MSSLLRKQRSRLGLPESPSSPVTSPKHVSHVKPQPVQQQHLRTTQVNNTSLSRTSRYRGGSLSKRYQVTKDDRNGDPFPHGDTVGNYGDMHKAGLKMNGDVNWDEDDTPLEEPQTIVIEDDDDETPEQRVPPLKTSQSELQDRLSSGQFPNKSSVLSIFYQYFMSKHYVRCDFKGLVHIFNFNSKGSIL